MKEMEILNGYEIVDGKSRKKNMCVITPELYGAIGDGVTNDTQSFLDMINNVKNNYIILLSQNYLVDGFTINGINNLKMCGNGCITLSDNCKFFALEFNDCDNLVIEDVLLHGTNKCVRGLNIFNCDRFKLSNVSVTNIGNDEYTESLHGIYVRNSHNGLIEHCFVNYVHSSTVASGICFEPLVDGGDETVPTNILVNHVYIEDIYPTADGDGIKILSTNKEVNLTVTNSVFKNCAKRCLKFQAKKCVSMNNTFYVGTSGFAVVDFQRGYGKSVDDTIYFEGDNISGITGYHNNCMYLSSFVDVIGLRVHLQHNEDGDYSGASSCQTFQICNLLNEDTIGEINIKDCYFDGVVDFIRNNNDAPVTKLNIENVTIEKFHRNYILRSGMYEFVSIKQFNIRKCLSWMVITENIEKYDIDYSETNTKPSNLNIKRPTNFNSTLVCRYKKDDFVSGCFKYEGGKIIYYTETNINPQNSTLETGKGFRICKAGDICLMNTPVVGEKIQLGWLCVADPDDTKLCGTWKELYV